MWYARSSSHHTGFALCASSACAGTTGTCCSSGNGGGSEVSRPSHRGTDAVGGTSATAASADQAPPPGPAAPPRPSTRSASTPAPPSSGSGSAALAHRGASSLDPHGGVGGYRSPRHGLRSTSGDEPVLPVGASASSGRAAPHDGTASTPLRSVSPFQQQFHPARNDSLTSDSSGDDAAADDSSVGTEAPPTRARSASDILGNGDAQPAVRDSVSSGADCDSGSAATQPGPGHQQAPPLVPRQQPRPVPQVQDTERIHPVLSPTLARVRQKPSATPATANSGPRGSSPAAHRALHKGARPSWWDNLSRGSNSTGSVTSRRSLLPHTAPRRARSSTSSRHSARRQDRQPVPTVAVDLGSSSASEGESDNELAGVRVLAFEGHELSESDEATPGTHQPRRVVVSLSSDTDSGFDSGLVSGDDRVAASADEDFEATGAVATSGAHVGGSSIGGSSADGHQPCDASTQPGGSDGGFSDCVDSVVVEIVTPFEAGASRVGTLCGAAERVAWCARRSPARPPPQHVRCLSCRAGHSLPGTPTTGVPLSKRAAACREGLTARCRPRKVSSWSAAGASC